MSLKTFFERRERSDFTRLERCLTKERLSVEERLKRVERSRGMQVFMWITWVVLLLYAVFALLYSTVVIYASGTGTSFLWFWPVTCVMSLAAVVLLFLVLTGRLHHLKTAAMGFCGLFWLLVTVFLCVEAVVFCAGRKEPDAGGEYVVILGAQVRGEVPTLVLSARIRAAAEYLKEHPEAIAVASGGKGSGENISEAEAIRRGLLRLGVSEERILLEDRSTSTAENLKFSAAVISGHSCNTSEEKTENVVLVTNDFHVFRAVKLAKKLGYTNVSGLGATDFFAVTVQYYVREFFAVGLEILRGNL